MKKYFAVLVLVIVVSPSVALAAWWNPLSWFNNWASKKSEPAPLVQVETVKTQEEQAADLQRQIKELKNKQSEAPTTAKPTKAKITPKASAKTPVNNELMSVQGSCPDGSFFSEAKNTCVSQLAYCQSILGPDATYNSLNNSCHTVESANTVCNNTIPNSIWGGEFSSDGKYICACKAGYTVNSSGNSCFKNQSSSVSQNDALDELTQYFKQQDKEYARQWDQALESKKEALNSMKAEHDECNAKEDEISQRISREVEANGGFMTQSQLKSMAFKEMQKMGMSQCFGSSSNFGGGYSQTVCHSLGSGIDCYGSSGTRIQANPIPFSNSFEINSW